MRRLYLVRGVSPVGRVVEVELVAQTAMDAKTKAEEIGLKFVIVADERDFVTAESPQGTKLPN